MMQRLWDWFQVKVLGRSDIYFGGSLYMERWRGFLPKWLPGIRLHHIMRSDGDREFHDHPFWFVSLILWGGYTEYRPNFEKRYGPLSIVFRSKYTLHRLELERPAWTLVLRGPIKRNWGFVRCDPWESWQEFTKRREAYAKDAGEPGKFAAKSSLGMHGRQGT